MSVYKEPVDWIRQSIDSILEQSFCDFEFIIVNDNPTRELNEQVLNAYIQKDSRIRVLNNEANIGLTKSLNRALSISRGEYIARMDADDISSPERLKKQVEFLDKHRDYILVGTWIAKIDENGARLENTWQYESKDRWLKSKFILNSQICHPAAMFYREINGSLLQYDEGLKYAQDYSLWASIMGNGKFFNIPEELYNYRISAQQISCANYVEQQECAKYAQENVFKAFGLPISQPFMELFFTMTIKNDYAVEPGRVRHEFCEYFKNIDSFKHKYLVLGQISGVYFHFIRERFPSSNFKHFLCIINNSSFKMIYVGLVFKILTVSKNFMHFFKKKEIA